MAKPKRSLAQRVTVIGLSHAEVCRFVNAVEQLGRHVQTLERVALELQADQARRSAAARKAHATRQRNERPAAEAGHLIGTVTPEATILADGQVVPHRDPNGAGGSE